MRLPREEQREARERAEQANPLPADSVVKGTRNDRVPSETVPGGVRTRIASFGPFRLHLTERVLEKNNQPIKIGSRAVDILITLIERAPEVVPRRDLVRRVWGELVVGEANLRVHVASLRKALVESDSSSRYVVNVPGRGYCFSSPVTWTASAATPRAPPSGSLRDD
jgi:DNA-binding winged helix-turn-helix (wHTH) protein